VTLARHGARVYLLSNVGADPWAEPVLAHLADTGVDVSRMGRHPSVPTGTVVMLAEGSGDTCYLAYPAASRTVTPAEIRERLLPLLPRLDGLFFNFEAPQDALQEAVALARAHDIPLFVDAGPEHAYPASLWQTAAVFSPNLPEAEALLDRPVSDPLAAARALLARGPAAVVLKLGAEGALWVTPDAAEKVDAFPIQAVDTAGAGDAFSAGLCWALLQGQPLPAAVRWASACGALVAGRLGTMPVMPWWEEVAHFLAKFGNAGGDQG
jgi:ribokinase